MTAVDIVAATKIFRILDMDFRESPLPEAQFPRRTLLGDSMNRGKDIPW
jgi:hypothetical protein